MFYDFIDLDKDLLMKLFINSKDLKNSPKNEGSEVFGDYDVTAFTNDDEKNVEYLEIAVPGFSKDEISVTIDEDRLKVLAHQSDDTFSMLKRADITYEKTLENPNVKIKAVCECGILRIRLETPEKKDTSRKIEIL